MKIAEINELQTSELQERLDVEEANFHQLKLNHSISPVENPSRIKETRRTIARIKTVLRQRELNK
ncbi:MAG: 50S ribosomal protein L29 [Prevotellaceae bacterium]|nr:50S ribosomal protein L29 [Prevotellaceae bacterium]MDD7377453.1 50S ribosomal protein L29 [Prevotellaceae bacterium]MDY4759945.1 50S ribosomal protein L29 [Bacteroidaceae bacterium]